MGGACEHKRDSSVRRPLRDGAQCKGRGRLECPLSTHEATLRLVEDLTIYFLRGVGLEGGLTDNELEEDYTKSPKVDLWQLR